MTMNDTVSRPIRTATASRGRRAGWVAMTLLATMIALVSSRYLTLNPEVFLKPQKLVYLSHTGGLLLHVAGGVVALTLGPWQFVSRLRTRRPAVHRFIGRIYLVAVLTAGVGGLMLAPTTYTGPIAAVGLGVLAVLLLSTSVAAYVTIRRRQVAQHRAWMTRSYALIFTAVTFRLWLGAVPAAGFTFEQAYVTGAWAAWVINLAVAELLITRPQKRLPRRGTVTT